MPKFLEPEPLARQRLVKRPRAGYLARAPYHAALGVLRVGQSIEVELEPGETLRQVKTRCSRAARDLGIAVKCGATTEGSVLVWRVEAR